MCTRLNTCAPVLVAYQFGDLATCEARGALTCELAQGLAGVGGAWPTSACTGATSSATCEQVLERDFGAACTPAPGTLIDGMACFAGRQCKGGACKSAKGQTCGVCGPAQDAAGPCTNHGDCKGALGCFNGNCGKFRLAGESCGANLPMCRLDLFCSGGTCTKPAGAGQACDKTHPLSCAYLTQSLWCKAGTCAKMKFATAGEACDADTICPANLCIEASKTCGAFAKDGEACDDTTKPCIEPADCVAGLCKLPNPASCK